MYGHVDANIMQITKLYSSLRFVCVDRTCVSVCVLVVVGGGVTHKRMSRKYVCVLDIRHACVWVWVWISVEGWGYHKKVLGAARSAQYKAGPSINPSHVHPPTPAHTTEFDMQSAM